MADEPTTYEQLRAIYNETHGDQPADGERYANEVGQHQAIWDALLLLAARIDGDAQRDPRAERVIEDREFDVYRAE